MKSDPFHSSRRGAGPLLRLEKHKLRTLTTAFTMLFGCLHSINLAYAEKPANQEQALRISDRVLDKAERKIKEEMKFRNLASNVRFYAIVPGRNDLIRGMVFDSAAGERIKRTFNGGVDYPSLWPVGRHVVAFGAMPGFVYTVAGAKPTMLVVTYSIKEDRLSDSFYY